MVSSTSLIDTEVSGPMPPVLQPEIMSQVQALNEDYLELLAMQSPSAVSQLQHFGPKLQASLVQLPAEHRARLAAAPYALYSLRFEDPRFWRTLCSCDPVGFETKYARSDSPLEAVFCEIALIQAWHIASTNPLAARVVYAMNDTVRMMLVRTPLWRVHRIALEHPNMLTPRWPTNPCFWPDLIAFVQVGDTARLATTKLLGLQLIAAELR